MTGSRDKQAAYVVLGESRRERLRTVLAAALREGANRWTPGGQFKIEIAGESGLSGAFNHLGGGVTAAEGTEKVLKLIVATDFMTQLLGSAAAANDRYSEGEIKAALQREILRSFGDAVLKAGGIAGAIYEDFADSRTSERFDVARRNRWCAAVVDGKDDRVMMLWMLHPNLVEALAPTRSSTQLAEAVEPRRNAIQGDRIRVEAQLGEAEVSLADLAMLAEGDVIVLDQPLAQPGHLRMEGGQHVANVSLGRSGESRAVTIVR